MNANLTVTAVSFAILIAAVAVAVVLAAGLTTQVAQIVRDLIP